jgi:hypothetical protein
MQQNNQPKKAAPKHGTQTQPLQSTQSKSQKQKQNQASNPIESSIRSIPLDLPKGNAEFPKLSCPHQKRVLKNDSPARICMPFHAVFESASVLFFFPFSQCYAVISHC